jgi:UPF0755 protein
MTRRRFALFFLALLLGLASVAIYVWRTAYERPSGNTAELSVTVPSGTSMDGLIDILAEKKLVGDLTVAAWVFRWQGVLETLQAGTYILPGDANLVELAEKLKTPPKDVLVSMTLLPGKSLWEVTQMLADAGVPDAQSLLTRAADYRLARTRFGDLVGPLRAPRTDGVQQTYLEGLLAADTYRAAAHTRVDKLLELATTRFLERWKRLKTRYRADILSIRQHYGLKPHQLITLASLIEKEVRDPTEYEKVAGVFYNRLRTRMRLQTDPSAMYAPGRVGRRPEPSDLDNKANPYNTYTHAGLPPGPICLPGPAALEAAIKPARHSYLYFVTTGNKKGSHAFARTYREHRANIRRYLRRRSSR